MNWDLLNSWIFDASGFIVLIITLLTTIIRQLPDLIDATRQAIKSIHGQGEGQPTHEHTLESEASEHIL
jgi:hypothetical protein